MAHDLRTPLTGLIAFAEVAKLEAEKGLSDKSHIEIIINKANEIKELTDQIFDFSVLNNTCEITVEDSETFESAFEDYLLEFCAVVNANGFFVQNDEISWPDCCVAINSNLMGRVFNNLISNICKYGEKGSDIAINISTTAGKYVCIEFVNKIKSIRSEIDSFGMGQKNVEIMMKEMGGEFVFIQDDNNYISKIILPVRE